METTVKTKLNLFNFLLNPWCVIFAILSGVYTGLKFKAFAANLAPYGEIFLSLLQMCILPILITAVISSLGRMIRAGEATHYIKKLIFIIISGLVIASLTGVIIGLIGKPGKSLNDKSSATLGRMVTQYEMSKDENSLKQSPKLISFFKSMVPSNIFAAFSMGQNLAILFFCVLLGIAMGLVESKSADMALLVTEALYDSFQKLIGWIMYALPFGLFCLFAAQVSQIGAEIFSALTKFIMLIYLSVFFLMIFFNIVIWFKVKGNFFKNFLSLRETLMVAFGTSSSFASIPSALKCLQEKFNVKRSTANLVIPLGINLNPQGSVLHFSISTIFIAQLYCVTLTPENIVIVVIGAIFAGMAATGMPGVGSLTMISLILTPLGLPMEAAIILLIAIDPIIDPVLTVTTIHSNCTLAVLVNEKD